MKAQDIHVARNKDKILVVLYSSRTHGKANRHQEITISASQSTGSKKRFFCPFSTVRTYYNMRGGFDTDDEPFMIFSDGSPVRPHHMRSTL